MRSTRKRVEAGINKIGPRRYRVEATILGGSRRARKVVAGDIHDARRQRERLRQELESGRSRGSLTVLKVRTVADVLDYYVKTKYGKTARYRIGSGKNIVATLKTELGGLPVRTLIRARVSEFIADMLLRVGPATVNTYLVTLRAAMRHCVSEGILDRCPIVKWGLLHVPETRKESIPREAVEAIQADMPTWAVPVLVFKQIVPCRLLELYSVPMENVNVAERTITVHWEHTKNRRTRELPIPSTMVSYFERMKSWGSPWAFARTELAKDGRVVFHQLKRNTITQVFRKIRDRHGLPKTVLLRKLRHGAISAWLRRYDPGLVSEVAGAGSETLRKYYDVVPVAAKLEAADEMSAGYEHQTNTLVSFRRREAVVSG